MKDFNLWPPIVSSCIIFFLILFVLLKNPKNRINQLFFVMMVMIVFWIVSSTAADISSTYTYAFFWCQIAIIGPFLWCPWFFYFCYIFPKKDKKVKSKYFWIIFVIPLLPLLFVSTKYNIQDISLETWGTQFTPGVLYYVVDIFVFIYALGGSIHLTKTFRDSRDSMERMRIQYYALATIILILVGVVTNSLLPIVFHYTKATIWGPSLAVVSFSCITAYAIVRHKLLDIRIFFKRTAIVLATYILFIIIISTFVATITSYTNYKILTIIIFSGLLFVLPYAKKKIEKWIKMIFPVEAVDISTFFDRTIYKLSTDSTEEFASKLKNYIKNNFKIASKVFIKDQDRGYWFELKNGKKDKIAWKKIIDNELQTDKTIIDVTGLHERKFEKNNITILIPMKFHGALFGIIALCDVQEAKLSHDDRELMEELGRRSAQVIHDLRDLEKAKAGARILANRLQ